MNERPDEIKLLPAYTLAEAARLIGSNPDTLRSWFRGRNYITNGGTKRVEPVLATQSKAGEPISFIDLVEAHVFLLLTQRYRIPRRNIRAAIATLGTMKKGMTSLAHRDFYFDDNHLMLQLDDQLVSLSERGQVVDKDILASGLKQLSYGPDGYASEFFPRIGNKEQKDIVVSPLINFGRLCIHKSGVSAEIIATRFNTGDTIDEIAEDFRATKAEIEGALRWHGRLAA
ncbi:MAG TPA: DUF433 domain-containing protein [Verrucomicrobiae bacterium]